MIQVRLYKNYEKRSDSTLQPGSSASYDDLSCTLKDNCSITAPRMDVLTLAQNPSALGYNYAYIPAFNRYYFINDWTYNMGVWTFSANEDHLASFKAEIGNLTKYVARASAQYNGYIVDSAYLTLAQENVTYLANPSPFTIGLEGSYIVGIIGKQQTGVPCIGGINYYLFTQAQMAEFITYLTSDPFATLISDDAAGFTQDIVKSIASPTDYIVSCMWFPFTIQGASGSVQPLLGFWNNIAPITGGLSPLMTSTPQYTTIEHLTFDVPITDYRFTLTDHPQIARGEYLNNSPYSNYVFHLDPWGDIPLNGARLLNKRNIDYSITCEGITGMATLELIAAGELLTRQIAQVGVSMSIAQIINDLSKISTGQVAAGAFAGIKDRVSNFINNFDLKDTLTNIGRRQMTGEGYLDVLEGAKGLGSDALSGITASISDIDSRGVNGSMISYVSQTVQQGSTNINTAGPYIKISRFNLVAEDPREIGRPLMAMAQLSTIPGYIKCNDGEHNIKCLASEHNVIAAYLAGGFIYE